MLVASTILEQLGGGRFRAMTGAKDFIGSADALTFSLPSRFAKDGINRVRITLTPADEYDMAFFKVRGAGCKLVAEVCGVYFDQLQEIFRDRTGLDTHL